MATRVTALIQPVEPRVAAQLVSYYRRYVRTLILVSVYVTHLLTKSLDQDFSSIKIIGKVIQKLVEFVKLGLLSKQ